MDHLPPQPQPVAGTGTMRSQSPVIAQVSTIFFLNMLARIALGPLLPTMEADLHIGHAEAGLFFLSISAGYTLILVAAGFISARINHRLAIVISALGVGLSMIGVALSGNSWSIRVSLFFLGLAAGLYLPSGVATLTSLVNPRHWGKVLSIHQLSPNLAYFLAPLLVEFLIGPITWRQLMGLYGLSSLAMGLFFLFRGRGGEFKSEPPTPAMFRVLYSNPNIWILIILFSLAIGTNQGLFGMMTLYLINSRGLDPTWTNHLIAISRISALAMPLLGGWLSDRIGVRPVMKTLILMSGSITLGMSLAPSSLLALAVILQAMVGVCFFPLGFAALSELTPPNARNLAVSATIPLGFLFGTGLIPAGVGWLGEMGHFDLAIGLLGSLTILGFFLLGKNALRPASRED